MGITRFAGPVYGAKSGLFTLGPVTGSTGATTSVIGRTVVPIYETWYVTELAASASTNSSNTIVQLKCKGAPTNDPNFPTGNAGTIASVNSGASTTGFNLVSIPTAPTPGEFEGYACPGGSSLRVVSSCVNPPSNLLISIRGFVRYLDSTRAV